jgi:hypothetical protein
VTAGAGQTLLFDGELNYLGWLDQLGTPGSIHFFAGKVSRPSSESWGSLCWPEWEEHATYFFCMNQFLRSSNDSTYLYVPDKRSLILEVVIVRRLLTWVLGIWRGEGTGKG